MPEAHDDDLAFADEAPQGPAREDDPLAGDEGEVELLDAAPGAEVDEPMFTPELEARLEKLAATYARDDWMDGNGQRGGNGRK